MKYVLMSDIHANDVALRAVVRSAQDILGDRHDFRYAFLGDLVGYGTMVGVLNCIRWLRSRADVDWLPGNHDEWIVNKKDVSFHGSAILSLLAQRAYLLQSDHKDDFLWFEQQVNLAIAERPMLNFEKDGLTLHFTHGSVVEGGERNGYLHPWNPSLIKWDLLRLRKKYPDKPVCLFYGHTHYPLLACLQGDNLVYSSIYYGKAVPLCDGMVAINPGSVGQPRDGDPRAAFAILDAEARTITFHRVAYDVEALVMQLEADGHFKSRFHALSLDEQDAIVNELRLREKKIDTSKLHLFSPDERSALSAKARQESKILTLQETYEELITRIRAGNKDANLSLYQGVYRKVEWGLEIIK